MLRSVILCISLMLTISGHTYAQNLHKPYHQVLDATVEASEYQQDKLSSLTLTFTRASGSGYRLKLIDTHALRVFTKHAPFTPGDRFKVMISILTDTDGTNVTSYSVINKYENGP